MKQFLTLIIIMFSLTSCFKTAEEIRREKLIDQMSTQLEQSSKLVAQLTQQVTGLQSRLDSTSGQLEEFGHKTSNSQKETQDTFTQTTSQLAEQLNIIQTQVNDNKSSISNVNATLKAQQDYLNKLNSTLAKLTGISSSTQNSSVNLLKKAHEAFEKNKQKEAKELYEEVLSTGKINSSQKNHIWFNLGLLSFWAKNYDDSSVWFSKIYTTFPKSSWAPRALLYIARCFNNQGKKAESAATYETIISQYASSEHAKTAKKEMAK